MPLSKLFQKPKNKVRPGSAAAGPHAATAAPNGTVRGAIHSVPCPWCGKRNDFRGLAPGAGGAQIAGVSAGWGDYLETGMVVDCDHCKRRAKIAGVQEVTVVTLRRS